MNTIFNLIWWIVIFAGVGVGHFYSHDITTGEFYISLILLFMSSEYMIEKNKN